MKGQTKNMSVQWKIFLSLLGFSAILLVVLYFSQIVFLGRFYRFVKINQVRSGAAAVAAQTSELNWDDQLEDLASERQMGIEVVTLTGIVRSESGTAADSILSMMSREEKVRLIRQAADNGGEIMVYFNRETFRESRQIGSVIRGRMGWLTVPAQSNILYARLFTTPQGQRAAVLISSMVAPVGATVSALRAQFFYIAGIMIVLSVLIAYLTSRAIARPIHRIGQRARTLAQGDYAPSFRGGGYREIDELADTLNYAAGELSRVDQMRRDLMANVSHDLRTPLTLISGYAEAMMDLPGEASPENARIIAEETRRLTALVNDMLDISRLESGKRPLHLSVFSLTDSLAETIRRLGMLVAKEGYTIEFHYDQNAEVRGDAEMISQAFYNLLINGIHYTGDDRKVVVSQKVEGTQVTVSVADSGPGIAPGAPSPYLGPVLQS